MLKKTTAIVLALIFGLGIGSAFGQDTEQDILNRYLQKAEDKHTTKLGWASINFSVDRINRNNTYNSFATYESSNFSEGGLSWLGQGYSLGVEFGLIFKQGVTWSLGGEYWLKMTDEISGSPTYLPTGTPVENPSSEIQVFGFTTGVQYYLMGKPIPAKKLTKMAVRVGGSVGYYSASWDLWPEYQNLNLATATSEENNISYKGTAPGFYFNVGLDYPINFWDMGLGLDMGYMLLNFKNVAWYNGSDEEIVASYNGTDEGRVDLDFSGVRGKVELKRYFNW
ncbi:MAG: hypothetical protein GY867_08095 [bacterium]|nr:hypothetical protein [bacterium]